MDQHAYYDRLDTSLIEGRSVLTCTPEDLGLDEFVAEALDPASRLNACEPHEISLMQALARAGINNQEHLFAYLGKGFELATQLRHAAVIQADRAAAWMVNVVLIDPARLHWHIRRLDGVAPSSAGAYVSEARGKRSVWTTARELDLTRLMMRLPSPPTWNTFRGTHLEDVNRALLYQLNGKEFARDEDGLSAIRAIKGTRQFPWLIGNPDDLAIRHRGQSRNRVLIDEKCPSEPKNPSAPISLDYDVQLHLYALLAEVAQRPVTEIALSHLYVDPGVARLWASMIHANPNNMAAVTKQAQFAHSLQNGLVEHTLQIFDPDPMLREEIIDVCSAADARVQKGHIAPWPVKPPAVLTDEQRNSATRLVELLRRAIPTQDAMEKIVDSLKQELRQILDGAELEGVRQPFPSMLLSESRKLRPAEAVQRLRAMGFPTEHLVRTTTTDVYDNDLIKAVLNDAGLPLDEVADVSLNIGLTRARKGDAFRLKQEAIADGERLASSLVDQLRAQATGQALRAAAPASQPEMAL